MVVMVAMKYAFILNFCSRHLLPFQLAVQTFHYSKWWRPSGTQIIHSNEYASTFYNNNHNYYYYLQYYYIIDMMSTECTAAVTYNVH